jgi:hypothetical protein
VPAAELAPPGVEDVIIENKNQLLARKRGFALSPRYLRSRHRDISAPRETKSKPRQ